MTTPAEQELALEAAVAVDDAPAPRVLADQLSEATAAVTSSESLAKSVRTRHPGIAKPLLDQASTLRARIAELRSRLAVLQERTKTI